MAWEQVRTDVIANNVANVNTNGFKRSVAVGSEFAQMVLQRLGDALSNSDDSPEVGKLGHGAALAEVVQDLAGGALLLTESPLDVALVGPGEFTFQGPDGPGYTRDGAFRLDSAGRLVTSDGYPVLVGGTPAGSAGQSLSIQTDGTVLIDGAPAGRLDIRGGAETALAVQALERSNVDMAQELTDLITALRAFQVNQRAMQMQDQTLSRVVTEIGKV